MNVHDGVGTVHVVRTPGTDIEVFASADVALKYARLKRGATVLERMVRCTLGDAQVVYERRVHVVGGVVLRDTTTEEPFFTIDAESWVQAAEVESFEGKGDRWTIMGLGTDRRTLDDLVEREIERLISYRLRAAIRRELA